jgi:hypothetical protein
MHTLRAAALALALFENSRKWHGIAAGGLAPLSQCALPALSRQVRRPGDRESSAGRWQNRPIRLRHARPQSDRWRRRCARPPRLQCSHTHPKRNEERAVRRVLRSSGAEPGRRNPGAYFPWRGAGGRPVASVASDSGTFPAHSLAPGNRRRTGAKARVKPRRRGRPFKAAVRQSEHEVCARAVWQPGRAEEEAGRLHPALEAWGATAGAADYARPLQQARREFLRSARLCARLPCVGRHAARWAG